jgi:hypothetical protein
VLHGHLKPLPDLFSEEERSKQPSAFSVVRVLLKEFHHPLSARLALVGAFGYDLLLQFDPSSANCRATTSRICTSISATTSISWIARRSASSATSTISRAVNRPLAACRGPLKN